MQHAIIQYVIEQAPQDIRSATITHRQKNNYNNSRNNCNNIKYIIHFSYSLSTMKRTYFVTLSFWRKCCLLLLLCIVCGYKTNSHHHWQMTTPYLLIKIFSLCYWNMSLLQISTSTILIWSSLESTTTMSRYIYTYTSST